VRQNAQAGRRRDRTLTFNESGGLGGNWRALAAFFFQRPKRLKKMQEPQKFSHILSTAYEAHNNCLYFEPFAQIMGNLLLSLPG
jgi:hypothetical protein